MQYIVKKVETVKISVEEAMVSNKKYGTYANAVDMVALDTKIYPRFLILRILVHCQDMVTICGSSVVATDKIETPNKTAITRSMLTPAITFAQIIPITKYSSITIGLMIMEVIIIHNQLGMSLNGVQGGNSENKETQFIQGFVGLESYNYETHIATE